MAIPETPRKMPAKLVPLAPESLPHHHRTRKLVHLICFLIFLALPFSNVMRFDIPRQRFYFFGVELWISEFGIIFFTLMFLMFLIVGSSVLYGRVYCGYMCPQMIFSESSIALENWLARKINKRFHRWPATRKKLAARGLWMAGVGAVSVFLAFIFISYFVEPRDLLGRLLSFDIRTAGGISGAVVTLFTFLDFTLVRQRFCTTVCPYGYLQGMLGDNHTLLVHYRDEPKQCIECGKCVRVCLMGIDIRKSPFQIECVHCGDCIDACADVLGRLGKPGLIHYTWGESGEKLGAATGWLRKLGFHDAKRVVVLLVTLFYLAGLSVALSMRQPVLIQLQPVRATLYRLDAAGVVFNTFRARVANRGSKPATVSFTVEGLPGGKISLDPAVLALEPGHILDREFEIGAARFPGAQDVNHFRIVASTAGEKPEVFEETFLMPPEGK
jgi:cytochrome c oxidase accessory protein FixG